LPQFSQAGSHVPSPQAEVRTPPTQFCVHGVGQSAGQVLQFSQAGLQIPFPQLVVITPPTHE
jgi:hypothetical protein